MSFALYQHIPISFEKNIIVVARPKGVLRRADVCLSVCLSVAVSFDFPLNFTMAAVWAHSV